MKSTIRRTLVAAALVAVAVAGACASVQPAAEVAPTNVEAIEVNSGESVEVAADSTPDTLEVMTLNLAHGRANGFHQSLLRRPAILDNLDQIATVLEHKAPDVVACQEADGPSFWSGNFDHVAYLAHKAGFGWRVRGEHVTGPGLSYGTALMSRRALSEPGVHTFEHAAPTPPKGFSVSTVEVGRADVDVVSVHLDFATEKIRHNQVRQLVDILERRDRPVVVMGDLNTEADGRAFRHLTEQLDLTTHRPGADDVATYGSEKRIDWILTSPELEIVRHEVVDETLSDHRGVFAELRLVTGKEEGEVVRR